MNALKKLTALFLAMAITLTFMPSLVFAEATDGDAAANEVYEPISNVFMIISKDGTDAVQNGANMEVGWDYVYTSDYAYETIISEATPYEYEVYLMIKAEDEDKEDTYHVLTPEEVFVTDMKGQVVDFDVTKADDDEYGKIRISFTKAGKYQIFGIEEREGVKEYYAAEIELVDQASVEKTVKNSKIKGLSVTAKRGSQTVKWKLNGDLNGYVIYRSTKPSSGYKKVATVNWTKTSYIFKKGLTKGKKYYYKVQGYKKFPNKKTVYTKYSSVVSAKAK